MKIIEISKNVIHIDFKSRYLLASSFMRMQEFYESPYPEIQGKYFTIEQYMDRYAKDMGNFTYTRDWSGFNIPGHVMKAFLKTFEYKEGLLHSPEFFQKELKLINAVYPFLKSRDKIYVIGTFKNKVGVLQHELAHAFYYLDENYAKEMDDAVNELPYMAKIVRKLEKMGYGKNVLYDEIQAYLSTSSPEYLKNSFKISNPPKKLRKIFKRKVKEI